MNLKDVFQNSLSPKPDHPFGKDGSVECEGCCKTYPLSGGRDLQFEQEHPLFGIRACSNVFSGAGYDLQGNRFDPQRFCIETMVLQPL